MVRTQFRHMERINDPGPMDRQMERRVWNNVLAYGLKRNLTVMLRQQFFWQDMTMMGSTVGSSGLGDLMVMAKYGLYRQNTAAYTLGVAATLGLELPTGEAGFTSDTYDLKPGIYFSWRNRKWASDFAAAYTLNGFAKESSEVSNPGNELALDFALARQFSIGAGAEAAFAPVLELSYRNTGANRVMGRDMANSGQSVLFISPGAKLTLSSLILEGLVQIPAWQDQKGIQPEWDTRYILGLRYMF